MSRKRLMTQFAAPLFVFALMAMAGCNKEPHRHHVKGQVVYGDEPLRAGLIFFDPVAGKNEGPQGYAVIKNGAFDTAIPGGKGVGRGLYVARIEGYEPHAGSESRMGKLVFDDFQQQVDLPDGPSEQNFSVPLKKKNEKEN